MDFGKFNLQQPMVETIDNVSIVSGDPFLSGSHRVAVDSDHQLNGRPFSRVVSDGLPSFIDASGTERYKRQ